MYKSFCFGLVLATLFLCESTNADEWKIEHNQFDLSNLHRNGATLRFSLHGANVVKETSSAGVTHIELDNHSTISIEKHAHSNHPNVSEYEFVWKNAGPSLDREVCFHYEFHHASWYSTYEEAFQYWPMDIHHKVNKGNAFVTGDFYVKPIGDIIEYLFINSDAFGVMLHESHPWFFRRDPNNGNALWCVSVSNQEGPYPKSLAKFEPGYFDIRFNIRSSNNIKSLYQTYTNPQFESQAKLHLPKSIPDEHVMRNPIWCTWAEYKANIDEAKVLAYAHQIVKYGFAHSQLEIDDRWDPHYGDFKFDSRKFPTVKNMIAELKKLGFRVTAWVHPYVTLDSSEFAGHQKYFIADHHGNAVITQWAGKRAAATDFSNPEASKWFLDRLNKLRNDTGLDGFKCDYGELNTYGSDYVVHDPQVQQFPSLMSKRYVETCTKFGSMVEVRTGFKSQEVPVFVRMLDKYSDWQINNGLQTVVTTSLMMSLAGYHFNLPDMIGGNAYGPKPDEELYIRWIQANTFLPSLQFSIPPWDYNAKVINITKKYIDLHVAHADTIIKLAKDTIHGGMIIRPMWFAEPEDPRTYKISDQFMLGDDLVVAPVLVKGQHERMVYLPSGKWIDPHGQHFVGPTEIKVNAPIEELPYFTRQI